MRIAVNTRLLLSGRLDGIGWFTYETVRRMVVAHPECEFFFFFDRKPSEEFIFASNVHPVVLWPQARHPVLWYMFFEWSVTNALRKYKIDLFLSPDGWMSMRTKVPTLTVIHDLNFEHADNYLKPSHQRYMTHFFPKFAPKASRVATVSEYSKQDICKTYGIPNNKVDVVYDGAHSDYKPYPVEVNEQTKAKYTNGKPYFIYIGTILKRKNLANLLLAFDKFKDADRSDTKLVVVGKRVWWQDELKSAFDNMRHQNDVVFVGRADSEQLAKLLSAAVALVYVSLFEGFGIPILEAFNAGTPVITSNITSMPEVAGDAALLVDPYNVDEINNALIAISSNTDLREQCVQKGNQQRFKFSWDLTAERLWDSLMKIGKDV